MELLADYDQLRTRLRSGDIVLFSATGFISRMIRLVTRSKWSHVGVVYRPDPNGTVFVYESTTMSKRRGVQTTDLKGRVMRYQGRIAIRTLEGVERTDKHYQAMDVVRDMMRGKDYERSFAELTRSVFGKFGFYQKQDNSSQFCSELVANVLQGMALLRLRRTPNSYTPADFAKQLDTSEGFYSDLYIVKR